MSDLYVYIHVLSFMNESYYSFSLSNPNDCGYVDKNYNSSIPAICHE